MAVEHQRRAAAGAGAGREHVRAPVLDLLPLHGEPELLALLRVPRRHRLLRAGEARDRDGRQRVGDQALPVDHGFRPEPELDRNRHLEAVAGGVVVEQLVEPGSDRTLHVVALSMHDGAHANGPFDQPVPELIRAVDVQGKLDGPHCRIRQARAGDERGELRLVREPEERRSCGDVSRCRDADVLDRVDEHAEPASSTRHVPHRERCCTARLEHARRLCPGLLGLAEMEEEERPGDCVEGLVLERDVRDVAADELGTGHVLARELEHGLGAIEPDSLRSARDGSSGHVPRAGRQVEEPRSGAGLDCVQQRLGEPLGDAPEQHVVGAGVLLRPAGGLECVECLGVVAHRSGPPMPGSPSGGDGGARSSRALRRARRRSHRRGPRPGGGRCPATPPPQAGRVPLVADEDQLHVAVGHMRVREAGVRVDTPFEHRPRHVHRARDNAVAGTLVVRAQVDDHASVQRALLRLPRLVAGDPLARVREEVLSRGNAAAPSRRRAGSGRGACRPTARA